MPILLRDADDEAEIRLHDGHFGILRICLAAVNLPREFLQMRPRNAYLVHVLPNVTAEPDDVQPHRFLLG